MRSTKMVCVSVLCLAALSVQKAQAQQYSLQSLSAETAAQDNTYGHYLDIQFVSDNSVVTSSVMQSFTGMDGMGNTQTMTFSGTSVSQSDYGKLHVMTTESLANSYFNANNSPYIAPNGDINDPNGSPTILAGLGRAYFGDTLQYGGALQSGYKAIYIFHVDGTNSGTGSNVGLTVTVDSNPSDVFLDADSGVISKDWVTSEYAVNGVTPQNINVYFQATDEFVTDGLTDGQNYTGTADFSSTLTLAAIKLVDQNGNPVSGWTVTSASGTQYNTIEAVPEPSSLALLAGMTLTGAAFLRRRKQIRKVA